MSDQPAPGLRPYQATGVAEIRAAFAAGTKHVVYVAPTGSGKTVLFAYVVAGAVARGNSVVIVGHRQEIVDQIGEALAALGVAHGIIAAGHPETPGPVQVASAATLVRRLGPLDPPDLLVLDEAHHAVAGTWERIIAAAPEARILGCTATPERLDGKGLSDVFDTMVLGPSVAELIAAGYLSKFAAFAPDRSPDLAGVRSRGGDFAVEQLSQAMSSGVVIGAAVDEYARRCPGAPAIVFAVDIAHSQLVAERFAERGYRAAHVDGNTPADERRAMIAALGTGELQVLCNCGLISEGVDVPNVVAAILLRPTKSLALHLQQVGRALRPAPDKPRALILDHAGNTLRHGLPDEPRAWSLEGRGKGESAGSAVVTRCRQCGALNPAAAMVCIECGAELRQRRSHVEVDTGTLVAAQTLRLMAMTYGEALRWAGSDEARLRLIAKARGYKSGWVFHRLREMRRA